MNVRKEKLRFIPAREGERGRGQLVINLRGIDLDGVNELTLAMEDIESLAAGREPAAESDEMQKLRSLLGG